MEFLPVTCRIEVVEVDFDAFHAHVRNVDVVCTPRLEQEGVEVVVAVEMPRVPLLAVRRHLRPGAHDLRGGDARTFRDREVARAVLDELEIVGVGGLHDDLDVLYAVEERLRPDVAQLLVVGLVAVGADVQLMRRAAEAEDDLEDVFEQAFAETALGDVDRLEDRMVGHREREAIFVVVLVVVVSAEPGFGASFRLRDEFADGGLDALLHLVGCVDWISFRDAVKVDGCPRVAGDLSDLRERAELLPGGFGQHGVGPCCHAAHRGVSDFDGDFDVMVVEQPQDGGRHLLGEGDGVQTLELGDDDVMVRLVERIERVVDRRDLFLRPALRDVVQFAVVLEVVALGDGLEHFHEWTELGSRDHEIRAVMRHLRHVFPFSSKRLWLPALHERKRKVVFANPRSAQVADGRN